MNSPIRRLFVHFQGRIAGTIFGLFVALIIVHYGVFKGSFILTLAAIGYVIGNRLDGDESLRDLLERILPPID